MELKNYFAQDTQGNAIPSANCYLYQAGTTTPATGAVDKDGNPLLNPFQADTNALIQFSAPNGRYDLRVTHGDRDYTIRVQCADVNDTIASVAALVDEATAEANRAETEANNAAAAAEAATAQFLAPAATDPTTRDNGSALQVGDSYFNIATDHNKVYYGGAWHNAGIVMGDLSDTDVAALIGALDGVGVDSNVQEVLDGLNLNKPDGSTKVQTQLDRPNSVPRILKYKNAEHVTLEDFGVVGGGASGDATKIQNALNSGEKRIVVRSGKSYQFEELIIGTNDCEIVLEHGSVLMPMVPTAKALQVTGARCTFSGGGKVQGQPVFDGANVRPTYALFWITGEGFTADNIVVDTVPKEAFMFEDATGGRIMNCKLFGRYPYASYDENSTTNHCGIMSNIPATAQEPRPTILVVGNYFEEFIQGMLSANYGAAGANTGNLIQSNIFKRCWDHGVYMSRGEGHNIGGNLFLDCRRPIVSDGIGSVVIGNVLFSKEMTNMNGEQILSVRESSDSIIANNVIYGRDAAIIAECLETTTMSNNLIINNKIRSFGVVHAPSGIRLGGSGGTVTTCENNVVQGNHLEGAWPSTDAAIYADVKLGNFGQCNKIRGNTIKRTTLGPLVLARNNHYLEVEDNTFVLSGTAASNTPMTVVDIDRANYPTVGRNKINYKTGGANVQLTGVTIGATCVLPDIKQNKYDIGVNLASFNPLNSAVAVDAGQNKLDPSAPMSGSFTWPSGVATFQVNNLNLRPGVKVLVTPKNQGAGAIIRDQGYFLTVGTQQFTMSTAPATVTAGSSDWDYVIF